MRTSRELDRDVAEAIAVTGGTMPLIILAFSEEEATELRSRLKGKHRAGTITVRLADPSETTPIMDRIRAI